MADKRKIGSFAAFALSMVVGAVFIAPRFHSSTPQTSLPETPPAEQRETTPKVAGASTVAPPAAVAIVADTAQHHAPVTVASTPHPVVAPPTPPAVSAPEQQPPVADPPQPPTAPTPETVVVNLKGPLTYTLHPGERSPVLHYEIIDKVQYEWKPGLATYWQDETPNPNYPVWSTIPVATPASPYVADTIPFVIQAAPNVRPGKYEVKMIMVIRPGIELGIPVVVTIPDPHAPELPDAPDPADGGPRVIQFNTGTI